MPNKHFSDWLRIDLHIHTDMSKVTKEGDYKGIFSIDILKQKMIDNNVGIFSLTDHNIINVSAYNEYYSNCAPTDPLLLLGIELDIVVTMLDGSNKDYHSLLIFNVFSVEKMQDISSKLENAYTNKGLTDKKSRKLTISEIANTFPEEDFFFIPHAGNTKSIIDPYKGQIQNAQRMLLLMQSAFEKVPEKAIQTYNKGFNAVLRDEFKDKNDVAYIDFSDNHNISKYPCVHTGESGDDHTFYYVKGMKSFETLRLAFIDPESRIKSQSQYEEIKKTKNAIAAIKIETHNSMAGNELYFSPHLNVVIGGRSSGKSLLMHIIGGKTDTIRTTTTDIYKDIVSLTNVKIRTQLDGDYKDTTSIGTDIIYINQGDVVRYFEQKNLEDLAVKSSKATEYKSSIDIFKRHKTKVKEHVDNLVDRYKDCFESGNRQYVLHDVTVRHIISEKYLAALDDQSLISKYDVNSDLLKTKSVIDETISNIDTLLDDKHCSFSEEEVDTVTAAKEVLKNALVNVCAKQEITLKRVEIIKRVKDLISAINLAQSEETKARQQAIDTRNNFVDEISVKLRLYRSLSSAAQSLECFDYGITEKIILNEDVSLVLEVPKTDDIKDQILDGLNGYKLNQGLYRNILSLLRGSITIKNFKNNHPTDLIKKIQNQLHNIYTSLEKPQDYLEYTDNETSKNKSPGYNSEKYLEIVLQNPKIEVIFIDQPEDNLGNRFIAERLVRILREIKFKKQLFLVTHNPSIVVFGDAESIIIAENHNKTISYKQIVLEDKSAQKEICGILDGGEYVFHNRSLKYNIERILREGETHA